MIRGGRKKRRIRKCLPNSFPVCLPAVTFSAASSISPPPAVCLCSAFSLAVCAWMLCYNVQRFGVSTSSNNDQVFLMIPNICCELVILSTFLYYEVQRLTSVWLIVQSVSWDPKCLTGDGSATFVSEVVVTRQRCSGHDDLFVHFLDSLILKIQFII